MSPNHKIPIVSSTKVVKTEIVEQLEPVYAMGVMQITVPTQSESMAMMYAYLLQIEEKVDAQSQIMQAIYNEKSLDVLNDIQRKLEIHVLEQTIEWTTLSILSKQKELSSDAIRKQLQSGDFEEGVDFKTDGNKIVVHQGAVGRIQRKRRSSNG